MYCFSKAKKYLVLDLSVIIILSVLFDFCYFSSPELEELLDRIEFIPCKITLEKTGNINFGLIIYIILKSNFLQSV
jgi:hypothetical protein